MQFHIVRAVAAHFLKLCYRADCVSVTAAAFPDIKRSTPVSVTAYAPVLNIVEPITKSALAYAFGNPVDCVVVADKIIFHRSHLYKPGISCIVYKRSITSPAVWIIMFKLRCIKQQTHLFKVSQHKFVSILNKHTCIWCFFSKLTLAVNELNKWQVIFSAHIGIVFTKCWSNVYYTCTVRHCYIAVAGDVMTFFVLLFTDWLNKVKQRLIFLVFKVNSLVVFDNFICRSILACQLAKHVVEQSICHVIYISVLSFNLAVVVIRIYTQCYV